MTAILPEHESNFMCVQLGHTLDWRIVDYDYSFGTAIFVRKDLIPKYGQKTLLRLSDSEKESLGIEDVGNMQNEKIAQFVTLPALSISIVTLHGLWIKDKGKADTPERLIQSKHLRDLANEFPGETILCGDFNLNPDTESVRILEDGRRNLIAEYGVTDTRTKYYPKEKPSRFADYTFVSPGIEVPNFKVPNLPISDHRPMIFEFNL